MAGKVRLRFTVEKEEAAGLLVASWDDPEGGGITTQGTGLVELARSIEEAIRCHFTQS
jgi:hypothetical protein